MCLMLTLALVEGEDTQSMPGVQSHEEGAWSSLTKQPGGEIKVRKARRESKGHSRIYQSCKDKEQKYFLLLHSCSIKTPIHGHSWRKSGTCVPGQASHCCAKGSTEQHLCVTHQTWNKGWRPWIPPGLCFCPWRDSEHPGPHTALLLGTSKHSS